MSLNILVVPGTGKQGRAAIEYLRSQNQRVSFLARNLDSDVAQEMRSLGADALKGNLDDGTTLQLAMSGVDGVFYAPPANPEAEIGQGISVVNAAAHAGVKHFVYSSVARTGDHKSFPGWNKDYPMSWYWTNKHTVEEHVRNAGFEKWTIFRPAFFLQNFQQPDVPQMWPGLVDQHELRAPFEKETTLDVIDAKDIGRFVGEAFFNASKYYGQAIALASEKLTLSQLAATLSEVAGVHVTPIYFDQKYIEDERRQGSLIMESYVWMRDVGYNVNITALDKFGLQLSSAK